LALVAPASSHAATILGSPLTVPNEGTIGVEHQVFVQAALPEPSAEVISPVNGTVVQWSIRGTNINPKPNTFKLRILQPAKGEAFIGAGTSAVASTPNGPSRDDVIRHFATALQIREGDRIGLETVEASGVPVKSGVVGGLTQYFESFADGTESAAPTIVPLYQEKEILFNAEVIAAPTSSATVPACSENGTVAVHVSTDPATTAKAVRFHIDGGAAMQSAVAVGGTASVTIPAGHHALEYWGEDALPQQEIVHHVATLQVGGCTPLLAPIVPVTPAAGPVVVAHVSQSNKSWREGSAEPTISRKHRAPVGTTFSFELNEQASVSFAFTQLAQGRAVKGKCVTPTRKNHRGHTCKRTVTRGTLLFTGHPGLNKVAFEGRISPSTKLKVGRYELVITATAASGKRSTPQTLSFSIVR
jgi:hypothetical protein